MFGNNPYQRRMPQYGGFSPYQQITPQYNGGFSGGFGGGNQYSAPFYSMGRDRLSPIRGGGMGQVIPTNIPFRDPGYGSPVRTQNLISAMSGPQDLMSDRRMGSLNMLDQLRSRPDYPGSFMPTPFRGGRGGRGGGGGYGGGGYNPIRTADFQDRNMNGVDDRDEGGGGIGGFFGGSYGRGMGGSGVPANPYGGRNDPYSGNNQPPAGGNTQAPPQSSPEPETSTPPADDPFMDLRYRYGADRLGNPLTAESYNYILNDGGEDTNSDGKIDQKELAAYSATEAAQNYMPGTLPSQLIPPPNPEGNKYGTRYDGKPYTESNFKRFDDAEKDGVGSADVDGDDQISEDEWLDWMIAKGPSEGYDDDWNTKIQGALVAGSQSGSIDAATRRAALDALGLGQMGNFNFAGGGKTGAGSSMEKLLAGIAKLEVPGMTDDEYDALLKREEEIAGYNLAKLDTSNISDGMFVMPKAPYVGGRSGGERLRGAQGIEQLLSDLQAKKLQQSR